MCAEFMDETPHSGLLHLHHRLLPSMSRRRDAVQRRLPRLGKPLDQAVVDDAISPVDADTKLRGDVVAGLSLPSLPVE